MKKQIILQLLILFLVSGCGNYEFENSKNYTRLKNGEVSVNKLSFINFEDWLKIQNDTTQVQQEYFIRFRINEYSFPAMSIFTGHLSYGAKVFINKKEIFSSVKFDERGTPEFLGWTQNLVELPEKSADGFIYFKVYSIDDLKGLNSNVYLGSSNFLSGKLFVKNAEELFYFAIYFAAGFFFLILFLFNRKTRLFFGTGTFLLSLSVFIAANSQYLQLTFNLPKLFYHSDYSGLLLATIGGLYSIREIVITKYKRSISVMILLHTALLFLTITVLMA